MRESNETGRSDESDESINPRRSKIIYICADCTKFILTPWFWKSQGVTSDEGWGVFGRLDLVLSGVGRLLLY